MTPSPTPREEAWRHLEEMAFIADQSGGLHTLPTKDIALFARGYRDLASDLLRARRDRLGPEIETQLDQLAARCHQLLYVHREQQSILKQVLSLLGAFPSAVRQNWRLFIVASCLFYGPLFAFSIAAYVEPNVAEQILQPELLSSYENMYQSAPDGRSAGENTAATGFYVFNNVGIAFRCFATGILLGMGSLWFLAFNGVFMGVIIGHLARVELLENLLIFVSLHSPWELTAIVISGAAGLQMGFSLVQTQGLTRRARLRQIGPSILQQITGAAAFLLLAALIEGWLSPSAIPKEIKYLGGLASWCLVGWLLFGFRRRNRGQTL